MEHRHEAQRNGVIGMSLVIGAVTLLVFFVAGDAYFKTTLVAVDYDLRLSAANPALEELRMRESIALTGYEWTDREAGKVKIPVDRAMELVIEDYRKAAVGE